MPHSDELWAVLGTTAPMVSVVPGASPFTYTAPDPGRVVVQGGTVTLIEVGRQGTFVLAGVIAGVLPVSRGDQVRVTYAVAPTMTFFKG
jgi:predicted Rossmann-fold nucleotide-binding protein